MIRSLIEFVLQHYYSRDTCRAWRERLHYLNRQHFHLPRVFENRSALIKGNVYFYSYFLKGTRFCLAKVCNFCKRTVISSSGFKRGLQFKSSNKQRRAAQTFPDGYSSRNQRGVDDTVPTVNVTVSKKIITSD